MDQSIGIAGLIIAIILSGLFFKQGHRVIGLIVLIASLLTYYAGGS